VIGGVRRWPNLRALAVEDGEDGLGIGSLPEFLPDVRIVQEFRDRGEGAQMGLELILRDQEENDDVDGFAIERLEVDPRLGTTEASGNLRYGVTTRMWYGYSETDTRAHRLLAVAERGDGFLVMRCLEMTVLDKPVHDLRDRLPPVGGGHLWNDLILGEQARESHVTGSREGRERS